MEPRSFDEMPQAIQALRERKTVILNLTMMDPDQAQRAVDFVAGGTFAIDGHQERVGESIFLFAPSCVNVTSSFPEEASPSNVSTNKSSPYNLETNTAPEPAWGNLNYRHSLNESVTSTIAVIGFGNIAKAIITPLFDNKLLNPRDVYCLVNTKKSLDNIKKIINMTLIFFKQIQKIQRLSGIAKLSFYL